MSVTTCTATASWSRAACRSVFTWAGVSPAKKDSILSSSQLCWTPDRNFSTSKAAGGALGAGLPNVCCFRPGMRIVSIFSSMAVSRLAKKPSASWPYSVSLPVTIPGSWSSQASICLAFCPASAISSPTFCRSQVTTLPMSALSVWKNPVTAWMADFMSVIT